jgi:hypothetical protein
MDARSSALLERTIAVIRVLQYRQQHSDSQVRPSRNVGMTPIRQKKPHSDKTVSQALSCPVGDYFRFVRQPGVGPHFVTFGSLIE